MAPRARPVIGELRGVVQPGICVDACLKLRPKRGEFQCFPIELREREFWQLPNPGWGGSLSRVAAVAVRRSIVLLRPQPALGSRPGFQKKPPALRPVFDCGVLISSLQVLLPLRLKSVRLAEERFRRLQLATQQVVIDRVDIELFQFRQETVQSGLVRGELPGQCPCCCGHSLLVLRIFVGRSLSDPAQRSKCKNRRRVLYARDAQVQFARRSFVRQMRVDCMM
ncbi:hypothetical protein T05_10776 [Trichinella murrelli]|uniref:Uncharacterized protein n=1 Tax=Trichinella murrelli TaxID=144512 RepID=A0A0V0TSW5_9BILA|nr:hypothetical protein T05_10776 [Trichinella murrelli]